MADNANVHKENNASNRDIFAAVGISAAEIISKLKQLLSMQTQFNLIDQMANELQSNPSHMSTIRDYWDKIIDTVVDKCPKITKVLAKGCLSSDEAKKLIDEIKKAKEAMANDIVIVGAVLSTAVIILQVWRLYEVWSAIKDAKNVIEDSKIPISAIQTNINQLKIWATKLNTLKSQYDDLNTSEQQKSKIIRNIRLKVNRMNSLYVKTRSNICELKVNIGGKIQVLCVYKKEQIANGIMNSVHFITNLIQCFQFNGIISNSLMVLQGIITGAFFGLVVGNGVMYKITDKTLAKLRDSLKQIVQLEAELEQILTSVNEAEDWIILNDG